MLGFFVSFEVISPVSWKCTLVTFECNISMFSIYMSLQILIQPKFLITLELPFCLDTTFFSSIFCNSGPLYFTFSFPQWDGNHIFFSILLWEWFNIVVYFFVAVHCILLYAFISWNKVLFNIVISSLLISFYTLTLKETQMLLFGGVTLLNPKSENKFKSTELSII